MPYGTKAIADRAYTSESVCATHNDEFDDWKGDWDLPGWCFQ
jgi:hypothetical protein